MPSVGLSPFLPCNYWLLGYLMIVSMPLVGLSPFLRYPSRALDFSGLREPILTLIVRQFRKLAFLGSFFVFLEKRAFLLQICYIQASYSTFKIIPLNNRIFNNNLLLLIVSSLCISKIIKTVHRHTVPNSIKERSCRSTSIQANHISYSPRPIFYTDYT